MEFGVWRLEFGDGDWSFTVFNGKTELNEKKIIKKNFKSVLFKIFLMVW